MKKTVLILCMCAICISANAQEKKSFAQKIVDKGFMSTAELKVGGGKGVYNFDLAVSLGYNFNKYISARIPLASETALFEKDGVRDWAANGTLGLGVGIIPFRFDEDDINGLLELYFAAGTTLTHKYDWQYTYYDCAINFADGKMKKEQVGFGIRYYNARKSDNRTIFYVSLGFRLN